MLLVAMKYNVADPLYYSLLHEFAKENKNHATEAEQLLWHFLSGNQLGVKFNRQHVIGKYIVDFVCLDKKLVVEVDGAYHSEQEQMLCDESRTDYLAGLGFHVLRFTNKEVMFDTERVVAIIRKYINSERKNER
ncbi:MAG: endonuclease domain-containing protein [Bacteroidales bacterium]|nr:endonuclease domain-containing protein [Bacteroidales bacterium]